MSDAGFPSPPYPLNDEWNPNTSIVQHSQCPPLRTPSNPRLSLYLGPDLDPDRSPNLGSNPSPTATLRTPISASTPSPSHSDLTSFSVRMKNLKRPLVTIEQIKSHLRLLRAFKRFQQKVEDLYSDPEVANVVPPIARSVGAKGRWLWFLEMAVERCVYLCYSCLALSRSFCMLIGCAVDGYRFRRWLSILDTSEGFFIMPPVDVWLIWHAYMLNPMSVPGIFLKSLMSLTPRARRWYTEDCERLWHLRPLKNLKEHPINFVVSVQHVLRLSLTS